jgi:hypothetical protein
MSGVEGNQTSYGGADPAVQKDYVNDEVLGTPSTGGMKPQLLLALRNLQLTISKLHSRWPRGLHHQLRPPAAGLCLRRLLDVQPHGWDRHLCHP